MAAAKGTRPPAAGKGRPKGANNKITSDVKACIVAAFDELGGAEYLVQQGRENPQAFMTLLGKIIPREMSGNLSLDWGAVLKKAGLWS